MADVTPPPPTAPVPPPPSYTPVPHGPGALPDGVELASVGRRVGAYFLAIPLWVVTLGIGYLIWGAIVWGKGTSPALQVLGMRAWQTADGRPATWGTMALRDIIGGIAQSFLGLITGLVSFVMFLSDDEHRSIPDRIASTIIVHDPGKVLG